MFFIFRPIKSIFNAFSNWKRYLQYTDINEYVSLFNMIYCTKFSNYQFFLCSVEWFINLVLQQIKKTHDFISFSINL
ncbi:hypothetical protein ASG31_14365 [Chryseobacterium sp. Leaf404]|nr:hypothetical protein ASG31_14365 [Chryseobacterium sp. Leaf404]